MKNLFFALALFTTASYVNAQKVDESTVPAAVKATFQTKCPGVTGAKWEKEDGNYEGHYKKGATKMTCVIDPTGKFVQSEELIASTALPKGASDYMAKNAAGKKITEASKITAADGTITYEAEANDTDYTFDASGNFLKKEADND